jgi:hypothetical protein
LKSLDLRQVGDNRTIQMFTVISALLTSLSSTWQARAALQVEILALRHQIGVLQRSSRTRPRLTSADRLFWAALSRVWVDWCAALVIVKPETVIGWHRKGFRLFWTWKGRLGQVGRPTVSREIRDLIRRMSRENLFWGAPRIHGELLKLGIDVGETRCQQVHRSLAKDTPERRTIPPPELGRVEAIPHLGGLHHRYERRAA